MLFIDIGNSTVTFGIYEKEKWRVIWKQATEMLQNSAIFVRELTDNFLENSILPENYNMVIISSVVPDATPIITNIFERSPHGIAIHVLEPKDFKYPPVKPKNPFEIGVDLLANANAAHFQAKGNAIIVDFGTALTFTTVNQSGQLLGVAIAPGMKTAMKSLSKETAQLPTINLERPNTVLGTDTITAIQAGVVEGYFGLVSHMLEKIKKEIGESEIFFTRGLASVLYEAFDKVIFDPKLTLNGVRIIYESIPKAQ